MVEHTVGALYFSDENDGYYLGVSKLDGENQLIGAPNFNLKGRKDKILLFNTNKPEVSGALNPLQEDATKQVGSVEPKSLRPLDKRVTDYIANMDPDRQILDAVLNGVEITVVLPKNFVKNYQL